MRVVQSQVFDEMELVSVSVGHVGWARRAQGQRVAEQPLMPVRISREFWLRKHNLTHSQWQAATGMNPLTFSGGGPCPV